MVDGPGGQHVPPAARDLVRAEPGNDRPGAGQADRSVDHSARRRPGPGRGAQGPPADQAVLFAAAAAARSDSYCGLAWGTQLASHAGPGTAAEVMAGLTGGLDPRGAALADWARRVALDPGAATPADISRLHDAGLTDQQIFEATMLIAWRVAFTAVNAALGAQPDAQLAGEAPAAVRAAARYGRPPARTPSV